DAELEFAGWMQRFLDANLASEEAESLNALLRSDSRWQETFVRYLTEATLLEEQLAEERAGKGIVFGQHGHTWILQRLRVLTQRKRPKLNRSPTWRVRRKPKTDAPASRWSAIVQFPTLAWMLGGAAAAVLLAVLLWPGTASP